MRMSAGMMGAVFVSVVFLLQGCSGATGGYSVLDRDPAPADQVPAEILAEDPSFDPDSSRLVGEDDGLRFWLAEPSVEEAEICLIVFPESGDDWGVACGNGLTVWVSGGVFKVRSDGAPTVDNETRISENVFRVGS